MPVKVFLPENRLADFVGVVDGVLPNELVSAAEARVEDMRESLEEVIAATLEEMLALGMQPEELVFADCREISRLALEIAEIAGAAGMTSIGEAARGVRIMIDSLFLGGVWHSDALRLHFEALQLLSSEPRPGPDEETAILARLQRMRQRVGVRE
jgi:hypothetical protein